MFLRIAIGLFVVMIVPLCSAQERLREITDPPEKRSAFEGRVYDTSRGGTVAGKKASVKSFYFIDKFRDKKYGTGSYRGTRTSAHSGKKFSTRTAWTNTGRVIPNVDRAYPAEQISKRQAHDAGREMETRAYAGVREAQMRGTAQGAIDRENGPREPLSLDQVREILNRSK